MDILDMILMLLLSAMLLYNVIQGEEANWDTMIGIMLFTIVRILMLQG